MIRSTLYRGVSKWRAHPSKRVTLASLLLLAVFAVSCNRYAIRVETDFDWRFRFAGVETYAWLPDPPGHAGDPRLHNALVDGRVRAAVNRRLQEDGYRRVPVEEADIHVTYYLGLEDRFSWRVVSNSYRYSGAGAFDHHRSETHLRQYERGTLLVDMLDPGRRGLVWRGSAQSRVRRESDPAQREQQIRDAVEKILYEFPPGRHNLTPAAREAAGAQSESDDSVEPETQ